MDNNKIDENNLFLITNTNSENNKSKIKESNSEIILNDVYSPKNQQTDFASTNTNEINEKVNIVNKKENNHDECIYPETVENYKTLKQVRPDKNTKKPH